MEKNKQKYPDLNDLAYSGRNKEYGSYYLRQKYPKYILASFLIALMIVGLVVIIPYIVYWIDGSNLKFDTQEIYTVEYTFIPSPEDDLSSLAKAAYRPPPPAEQVPEVDTVKEIEKEKPDVREEKQDEKTDVKPDSSMASKGQSNDGKGSAEGTGLVTTLDVFPRFPGGDQARLYFLRSNIKYPSLAIKAGIQGDVMVLFIVEADGTLSNVSINKGIGGGCDEEAIRVTKLMPGWDPGKRSGKSVRVLVRMPIVFKIPGKK